MYTARSASSLLTLSLLAAPTGSLVALEGTRGSSAAAVSPTIEFPADPQIFSVQTYGAKGDGITDDTEAIKKCFAEATTRHFRTIYFPNGTYLVSDTFGWKNFAIMQGQNRDKTIIRLKETCPGYGDPNKPKAVVRCLYNNNESIGNYMSDFTVDTGKGNSGAIAIRYNCHNWGTCERITIRSGDGAGRIGLDLSETEFGPALVRNIEIDGFDLGIKTPGQPSSAVLERITLRKQKVAGIENSFPLSLRKLISINSVPAVVNKPGCLTQLVLIDADLGGGAASAAAIENTADCVYLRDIRSSGYGATLKDNGKSVSGAIGEYLSGNQQSLWPSEMKSLNLPIVDPPETLYDPVAKWKIVDKTPPDSTKAIQDAIDSGARTICFRSGGGYTVSDTIHIRGAVRRIIGLMETDVRGDPKVFSVENKKPVFRFDGKGTEPITMEHMAATAWPNNIYAIEFATAQTIYLKGFGSAAGCDVRNSADARKGKLFIDEWFHHMKLDFPQDVWIWQCNTENNPFNTRQPKFPTYLFNNGGRMWVFGMKTESPAINAVTTGGGCTEILGGFFRDHFAPAEYGGAKPSFITIESYLTAIYTQYAWGPGKARDLQAEETRKGETKQLKVVDGNYVMGLYSAVPPGFRVTAADKLDGVR